MRLAAAELAAPGIAAAGATFDRAAFVAGTGRGTEAALAALAADAAALLEADFTESFDACLAQRRLRERSGLVADGAAEEEVAEEAVTTQRLK